MEKHVMALNNKENEIAVAIKQMTAEMRERRISSIVTKNDLAKAVREIIKAIKNGGGNAAIADATQDLKSSTDDLQDAVNKNK